MKLRIALPLVAVVGISMNCMLCGPVTPGGEGDQCTFDSECGSGLRCVHDKCAPVTADGGASDAATQDGQRTDLAGTDHQGGLDTAGTDHHGVDGARPDAAGHDLGLGDTGWRLDVGGGDLQGYPDRPLPDWTGVDWAARDLNVFVDGGINVDAGVHSYDGGYEPGVVCGTFTCTGTQRCCIGYGATYACADTCTGTTIANLQCDDTQDCGNTGECCGSGLNTFCITTGTCLGASVNNYLVCTNGANCVDHAMVCCTSALFRGFGVDLGWCQVDLCQ